MSAPRTPVVVFDLEMSGSPKEDDEVVQIAASTLAPPSASYNAYVVPARGVSDFVTGLTGLAKEGGALMLHGRRLATVSRRDAVAGFLDFLASVRGAGTRLVLVAHGNSDAPRLIDVVAREGLLPRLADLVCGFADTLPLFRKALPDRLRTAERGDFGLAKLAHDFEVMEGVDALHDAVQDVLVLKRLIAKIGVADGLASSAKPLASFRAYKQALNQGGPEQLVHLLDSLTLSDDELLAELRTKLSVLKTLEQAAEDVRKKLPELVEHAGWSTNFYVGQVEEKGHGLESAREELQDALDYSDTGSVAVAKQDAIEAVSEAAHMRDWLQLVEGNKAATWTMELERQGCVWKGSFEVSSYSAAGHPALYALLHDGVLQKGIPSNPGGSAKDLLAQMRNLEKAARKIQGPLEHLFAYLEFYRNRREEDLLVDMHRRITGTKEYVEDVLRQHAANVEMVLDAKDLADDALERDQFLADWLLLVADPAVQVRMEVRRGGAAWKGAQAMDDFPHAAQVLLFDAMRGGDVARQQ